MKTGTMKVIKTIRPNGTIRVVTDFSECVSLTEQHTANQNDINYLVKRYSPDELAMYLASKQRNQPITGHDFSKEPTLQEAMTEVHRLKTVFNDLPEDIRRQFTSPLDFVKFCDNPHNAEKLIKMGILKPKDIPTPQPQPNDDVIKRDDKTATPTPKSTKPIKQSED